MTMTQSDIYVGNAVTSVCEFTTPVVGQPQSEWPLVDPSTVEVTVIGGTGASPVTYGYGSSGFITRVSEGVYSCELANNVAGTWRVLWEGTGACASVGTAGYPVLPQPFPGGPAPTYPFELVQTLAFTGNEVAPLIAPTPGNLAILVLFQANQNGVAPTGWNLIATDPGECCCGPINSATILVRAIQPGDTNGWNINGLDGGVYYEFSGYLHFPVAADRIINQTNAVSGTQYTSSAVSVPSYIIFMGRALANDPVTASYVGVTGVTTDFNGPTPAPIYQVRVEHAYNANTSPIKATWTSSAGHLNPGYALQVY